MEAKFPAKIAMSLCGFTSLLLSHVNHCNCMRPSSVDSGQMQSCLAMLLLMGDHTASLYTVIAPAWDVPGGFVLTKYSSFCAARSFFALGGVLARAQRNQKISLGLL